MAPAALLGFLGGLLAGSFVTVVAHRVPRGESIVGPRSRCPGCGTQIAAYDNVPVLSWAVLRGRARCCGASISARYPLTELALGALYAATVLVLWDDPTELALGLVFVTTLVAVTLTDLERRIIPNKILLVAAVLAVAIAAVGDPGSLPERAIAAAAAGGLFFAAALAYPKGMGLGDVKLAATMGLFLGRDVAPAIFVALLAGSIVGLAMMAREGAGARKRGIPFGPFLAFGGVAGLLLGDELIDLYLGTFS
ncbi:MAG TPA: prepilin peptidase [Solirubrobacterales bacterium]|nr:prepilin peptidase [Solirubrobacterales bacterium]